MIAVAASTTIRHTKISDYDVLCVVHLPDSSLFSDISDDRIDIVAAAIVKRCVETEKGDKNPATGKFRSATKQGLNIMCNAQLCIFY